MSFPSRAAQEMGPKLAEISAKLDALLSALERMDAVAKVTRDGIMAVSQRLANLERLRMVVNTPPTTAQIEQGDAVRAELGAPPDDAPREDCDCDWCEEARKPGWERKRNRRQR